MKKIYKHILLLLAFNYSLNTISRAQGIEWQNTMGGNSLDYLKSIQQTADGGYILGGYSNSNISGDKTENGNGQSDYWIVKTDATGNIQWQNTIGGSSYDYLTSIRQTADGGYILGGFSRSVISGDKTENQIGNLDYWIVKTDANGNIQWQNTIGGTGDDELNSIQQTSDGGYILGGWSESNISGDKTENSIAFEDYWIVKTDSLGNIQWQNTIGGDNNDYLNSIHQTADGGYILGGYSASMISGDKTEDSPGPGNTFDYWIVKTDSQGNIQWQNTIAGYSHDCLTSIRQTADGGYILGGWSASNISGDKTENCMGSADYWIVKTDSLGNIQWQNTIGGSSYDYLTSIRQTADGGYILGGYSGSNTSGDKTENCMGIADYWIVKTDSLGNIQWQNTIGGNGDDEPYSIQQTADGGFILGGFSKSDNSGDKTENSIGDCDYWLVKLTEKFNTITGNLFADLNSNSVRDAGEPALANKKITEQSSGRIAFSVQNGNYSVTVLDSGNFSIVPDTINFYTAVPATHSVYFSGIQQIDSLNDFAFQPTGVYNDVWVTITPLGPFRSGFNASYMINYGNYGSTILLPDVIFFPYPNVTYLSSSIIPTSVAPDSVVWSLTSLSPYQTGSILVTVTVDMSLPIGTLINSSVSIEPVAGDVVPVNNSHSWEVYTIGSYDPNDMLVSEDTINTTQLATSPDLVYTIRFQNTGNDTAFVVKILNPVDTNKLELSSIEFVNSSHPVNLQWIPWERNMEFKFDNILLPDSNANEPASHGFVSYRIKPKTTLGAGDSIVNNAYIYFDFNAPVSTNIVITAIVLPIKTYSTIYDTACNSYLSPSGNYSWTTTGTYLDTIPNYTGGDSVITVNVVIRPAYLVNTSAAICPGDSIFLSHTWQTVTGVYYDSLGTVLGCDSVIATQLIIETVYQVYDTLNIISGDSLFIGGGWQTIAGIYTDSLTSISGCDSVVTTVLNILTALNDINTSSLLTVKPNPSNDFIIVDFAIASNKNALVIISDLKGKTVLQSEMKTMRPHQLDISKLSRGVYILKFICNGKNYYQKFVKE